jgi:hypothetical protein
MMEERKMGRGKGSFYTLLRGSRVDRTGLTLRWTDLKSMAFYRSDRTMIELGGSSRDAIFRSTQCEHTTLQGALTTQQTRKQI